MSRPYDTKRPRGNAVTGRRNKISRVSDAAIWFIFDEMIAALFPDGRRER